MNKKINFSEQELSDLKTVLKAVEPEIGIPAGRLYRIYDVVFSKWYESKLGFSHEYIDADKCHIKIGDRTITAREITEELMDQELILKFRVHAEDENGNKLYHGPASGEIKMPVQRTLYKTNYGTLQ